MGVGVSDHNKFNRVDLWDSQESDQLLKEV